MTKCTLNTEWLFKRRINNVNNLNILIYTSVETSTGTKKCKFFAKTVILEPISVYVIWCVAKNSRELPEDGIDKRRNASELKKLSTY